MARRKPSDTPPTFVLHVPLFSSTVNTWVSPADEHLLAPDKDHAEAVSVHVSPNTYALFVHEDTSAGVLAHEAVHLAHWIIEDNSLPNSPDDDELLAYLVQHLVDDLHPRTRAGAGADLQPHTGAATI